MGPISNCHVKELTVAFERKQLLSKYRVSFGSETSCSIPQLDESPFT